MKKGAILCVDDESIILESLKEQLENELGHKYIYETAESADEAFEVLEELIDEDIDVLIILSDWLMPGTKGDEFLIKVHQHFPGIVKVMLTGQATPEAIEKAREEANLHAVLGKPWSESELINVIKEGLQL